MRSISIWFRFRLYEMLILCSLLHLVACDQNFEKELQRPVVRPSTTSMEPTTNADSGTKYILTMSKVK